MESIDTNRPVTRWGGLPFTRWGGLRCAAAVLLFAAAIAKSLNIIPILAGDGLLSSKPLLLGVIALEVAAGLYLLLGEDPWCWRLMLVTFLVFALASCYALLTGRQCNCMGSGMLGPHFMLPLDLVFLVLTVLLRPPPDARVARVSKFAIVVPTVCLLLGVVVAGGAAFVGQPQLRDDGTIEFLLADDLSAKSWPMGSAVHPQLKALELGKWLVLVVRRDCSHCRELLEKYFSDPLLHPQGTRTALFVAGSQTWPFQFDRVDMDHNGDDAVTWVETEPFVASPALFLIEDGMVVDAGDGDDADVMLETLGPSLIQ